MNTRKSIFFSRSSVRIQLQDTKGVKSQSENRKLDEKTLVSRKVYLFHPDFSPCSNLRYQGRRELCTLKDTKFPRLIHWLLHNLCYVLFFIIRFTNGFFDAFNCRNHCILKILCVRHWHIFPRTTADRCIQVIKCF